MTTVELNGELIADYLDQRELWSIATMIKRDKDEAEGSAPNTYLGLQVVAPEVGGRFGVRPMVTGATEVPVALPASGPWAGDPCGDELPLGFSIEEVGALGGAGGQHESMSGRVEIAAPAQVSGADSGKR
jgi:hypothetical protein